MTKILSLLVAVLVISGCCEVDRKAEYRQCMRNELEKIEYRSPTPEAAKEMEELCKLRASYAGGYYCG